MKNNQLNLNQQWSKGHQDSECKKRQIEQGGKG